jgi:hypothetical protein
VPKELSPCECCTAKKVKCTLMPNNAHTGRGDRHKLAPEYIPTFHVKQHEVCIVKNGKKRASVFKTSPSMMLGDLQLTSSGTSYAPSESVLTPSETPSTATNSPQPLVIRIPPLKTSAHVVSLPAVSVIFPTPVDADFPLNFPITSAAVPMALPTITISQESHSTLVPSTLAHTSHICSVMALMSLFKVTMLLTSLCHWREGWTSLKTGCPRSMSGGIRMRSGRECSLTL